MLEIVLLPLIQWHDGATKSQCWLTAAIGSFFVSQDTAH